MKYSEENGVDTNGNNVSYLKDSFNKNFVESDEEEEIGLNDDFLPVPKLSIITASLVVFFLSFSCFCITINGGLYFDDTVAVVSNKDVHTDTPIINLFHHDFWGTRLRSSKSHKSYRPLTVLTYRWNFMMNGFNPRGYHIVNVLLYSICCVLIIPVCSLIIGGAQYDAVGDRLFAAPRASFLCGCLFAVHPVHTENVAAIVGRADLICLIFYAVSFLSYAKFSAGHPSTSWSTCIVSLSMASAAMLAKEQGITVLGVCICYDVVMVEKITAARLLQRMSNVDESSKQRFHHFLQRILVVSLTIVFLMGVRLTIMGEQPKLQYGDNPASFQDSFLIRLLNYNYIYALNLWLLIVPWWLCFDWAMGCVPVITSFADVRLVAPFVMWSLLLLLAVRYNTMSHTPLGRCLAMALVFLVVPFLPAMNIFFRVGFVIAERNLFISSLGAILFVVIGFTLFSSHSTYGRRFTEISTVFLLLIFAVRCVHRSYDWLDEVQLYTSGLRVCPLNAKVHYNIGKSNQDAGNTDQAISAYLEAIRLWDDYDQPLNNLGNIYKEQNMLLEAEYYLEKAVRATPTFHTAWMNLGNVKAELKKKKEAIQCFTTAIDHKKVYPDAYYNWGYLHLVNGEYGKALEKLNTAIQQKSDHYQAWRNKIILLGNLGMGTELLKTGTAACRLFPADDHIHQTVGNSLGIVGNVEDAEQFARKAFELNPSNFEAASTLGVIYHRLQRYTEAERFYTIALGANPDNEATKSNYAKLLKIMGKHEQL